MFITLTELNHDKIRVNACNIKLLTPLNGTTLISFNKSNYTITVREDVWDVYMLALKHGIDTRISFYTAITTPSGR